MAIFSSSSAAAEFGHLCQSATHLVSPPGEGGISEEFALWSGLLDYMGRLERAAASAVGHVVLQSAVTCEQPHPEPE